METIGPAEVLRPGVYVQQTIGLTNQSWKRRAHRVGTTLLTEGVRFHQENPMATLLDWSQSPFLFNRSVCESKFSFDNAADTQLDDRMSEIRNKFKVLMSRIKMPIKSMSSKTSQMSF